MGRFFDWIYQTVAFYLKLFIFFLGVLLRSGNQL
jgi:hypothetical protein